MPFAVNPFFQIRNADFNVALNILTTWQAVLACGTGRGQVPVMEQKPVYGAAK